MINAFIMVTILLASSVIALATWVYRVKKRLRVWKLHQSAWITYNISTTDSRINQLHYRIEKIEARLGASVHNN